MDPPGGRHTCLRLRLGDGEAAAVVFVKGTWFAARFDLSVTDGLDAWTCNATEAEVKQRAEQWDQLVPEYIALAERYLGSQQPGSVYKLEDAGNGQRRLSWTFEKQGTKLEWRWKCQPSPNNKQITVGILDFLFDANIRFSMMNGKVYTNVTMPAVKNVEVKGKQKLKGDRVKAVWDDKKHAVFIKICLDQMRAGNKPHKTLNKLGYMNLEREFCKQTGFRYYKDQLKNHWDSTRRDWQAWNALRNQTGIGWDETRGTYSQTEEWWVEFSKRFPGGDKFAHRPLDHADELDVMFGEGSGRSDAPESPSSDATPSAGTRDSQSDPTPESHAEAEELNCPTIGNQNSTPSRSPRIEEFGETIGPRYPNSQTPAARPEKRPRMSDGGMNWETCMKQVYDILIGGSRLLAPSPDEDPTSIPNTIALLNETCGIVRNSEEWLFAASKFRNESVRQLFFALGDPESRTAWIRREYKLSHG
uniref:DNA repair protein XRCC4 n=1 Tax=Anthurium amnicola TaxID=1678845 RepID=A0A1D1YCK1_9ARAE